MDAILEIKNLNKEYRKNGSESVVAVDDVSFSAYGNEILGILGPNGSGKTTIIKSIASLIEYDSGEISFQGKTGRKHFIENIGAVLEGARNIHWKLTPYENLKYYAGIKGLSFGNYSSFADELLERLGLSEYKNRLTGQLSRGNQQKVAIACALLSDPDLLLLDEPTLGLDVETVISLKSFFREIVHKNRLIIITSHDMRFIESICDRILIIKNGRKLTENHISGLKHFFRKKSISIKIENSAAEAVKKELSSKFAFTFENEDTGFWIKGNIEASNDIYQIMDILKNGNVKIADIHINDNDFESIFVEIINTEDMQQ